MKFKLLLVFFFLFGIKLIYCQQVAIGMLNNNILELTDKSKRALKMAYLRSFVDGRKLDTAYIDLIGNVKYLILVGSKSNVKSKTAISITILNNTVNINTNTEMKTCSNGACEECSFFTENKKIVACKCEQNGSISNNCNFKINDGLFFYTIYNKVMNEQ